MSPEEISRLRELCEKATPGPWEAYFTNHGDPYVAQEGRGKFGMVVSTAPDDYGRADCQFIALARTALPQLLDELQKRDEEKAEVERIALWALDGVSMYLQCGAERTIRESVKTYVDKTRETIREGQRAAQMLEESKPWTYSSPSRYLSR